MDLQSFTLGIVSVMISITIGVIIFIFLRVQKYRKEITSLKKSIRHTHNYMCESLPKTQDHLSKIMEGDRQEMFKMFDNIARDLNLVKEGVQSKESSLTSYINQRFDKFENRLNTSCFKGNNDDTLYS
jgi:hemerythrin-like domain-containing protein